MFNVWFSEYVHVVPIVDTTASLVNGRPLLFSKSDAIVFH